VAYTVHSSKHIKNGSQFRVHANRPRETGLLSTGLLLENTFLYRDVKRRQVGLLEGYEKESSQIAMVKQDVWVLLVFQGRTTEGFMIPETERLTDWSPEFLKHRRC
jgi:hypothetical protein